MKKGQRTWTAPRRRERLYLRLAETELRSLRAAARERGVTVSSLVRVAIARELALLEPML